MTRLKRQELYLYIILWVAMFVLIPLVEVLSSSRMEFSWAHVLHVWGAIIPFLVLFLAHHFLVLPLAGKNVAVYIVLLVVLLALFSGYIFTMGRRDPGFMVPSAAGPDGPPPGFGGPLHPEILKVVLGFMLLMANLGIQAIFALLRKEKDYEALERENLRSRLESLRYQINPHFFLNTLNNIKALVLIDPAKAEESIDELSRMMRIVLYESASVIPLSEEIAFLSNFISLMKLRYTEDVKVETVFPADAGEDVIQPLVLSTFVENAFKHGVSYRNESFIRVAISRDGGRIRFTCVNSVHSQEAPSPQGGVGLENTRKRLSLTYGEDYFLTCTVSDGIYSVSLDIPGQIPKEL